MRCAWLLCLVLSVVTVLVDGQTCDPNGAISSCMQAICTDKYEEIPSALCAMMELRCCRLMCDGPGTLFIPNLSDCGALGMHPRVASVECYSGGMCCAYPYKPENWPDLYPWPPLQGWPPGFEFPTTYDFPRVWPAEWKPIPASAYPQHKHQEPPAPNYIFINTTKSQSQTQSERLEKRPSYSPLPTRRPWWTYGNYVASTSAPQKAVTAFTPPSATFPPTPASSLYNVYNRKPNNITIAQNVQEPPSQTMQQSQGQEEQQDVQPIQQHEPQEQQQQQQQQSPPQQMISQQPQLMQNTDTTPLKAAAPANTSSSNTTENENDEDDYEPEEYGEAPAPTQVPYIPSTKTTKSSSNEQDQTGVSAQRPMAAAPLKSNNTELQQQTDLSKPISMSTKGENKTENQQNNARPTMLYRVIPLTVTNITEPTADVQNDAIQDIGPTTAVPVTSRYQTPKTATEQTLAYHEMKENLKDEQGATNTSEKYPAAAPTESTYTENIENDNDSEEEDSSESEELPTTFAPNTTAKHLNLSSVVKFGDYSDQEQYIIKALQANGYNVMSEISTDGQSHGSNTTHNASKSQNQSPSTPAAAPPSGQSPPPAPVTSITAASPNVSKPIPSPSSLNSTSKKPAYPSVWKPTEYDYRPNVGPTTDILKKPNAAAAPPNENATKVKLDESNSFSNKPTYPAVKANTTSNSEHGKQNRVQNYQQPSAAGNNIYQIPTFPPPHKLRQNQGNGAASAGADEGKSYSHPQADERKPAAPSPQILQIDLAALSAHPGNSKILNAPLTVNATIQTHDQKETIKTPPKQQKQDKMEEKIKKIVYKALSDISRRGRRKKHRNRLANGHSSKHKGNSVFPVISSFP